LAIAAATYLTIVNSDAYRVARSFAVQHPKTIAALGAEASTSLAFGRFGFKFSSSYSFMRFALSLEGSKGRGKAFFELSKRGEEDWRIDEAELRAADQRIDLLDHR
jgi:hypothetical protein